MSQVCVTCLDDEIPHPSVKIRHARVYVIKPYQSETTNEVSFLSYDAQYTASYHVFVDSV